MVVQSAAVIQSQLQSLPTVFDVLQVVKRIMHQRLRASSNASIPEPELDILGTTTLSLLTKGNSNRLTYWHFGPHVTPPVYIQSLYCQFTKIGMNLQKEMLQAPLLTATLEAMCSKPSSNTGLRYC